MTKDEYEEIVHRDVSVAEEEARQAEQKEELEKEKLKKEQDEIIKLTLEEDVKEGDADPEKAKKKVPGHIVKKKDPYVILMGISIGVLVLVVIILVMGMFRRPPQNSTPQQQPQPTVQQQPQPTVQQTPTPQTPTTQQTPTTTTETPTTQQQPTAPVGPNGETAGQLGPNGEQPPSAPTAP